MRPAVLATVLGYMAMGLVGTGTVASVRFWIWQGTNLPKDDQFQTPTAHKTAVFLVGFWSQQGHIFVNSEYWL